MRRELNVYLEPKRLRCLPCCSGLELIGPAHEELETPEAVGRQWAGSGQALRLEVILLSKEEKAAAPHPGPEAGLAGGLAGGLEAGVEAGLEAPPRGTGRQAWRHALSRWPKGYGS